MGKRRKLLIFWAIFAICLVFTGCANKDLPEYNENITPVIEAMVNAPNPDYFSENDVTVLGQETADKLSQEERSKIDENWAKIEEKYFAPNCFGPFQSLGLGQLFHMAVAEGDYYSDSLAESIRLEDIELAERKANGDEAVIVKIIIDEKLRNEFEMVFSYDKDGLIEKVDFPRYTEVEEIILEAE